MRSPLHAVATSAAVAFLAGLALWPPRAVYWMRLAAVVGDGPTLAFVGLVAVAVGAAFVRVSSVDVRSFTLGGLTAYLAGMIAIEVVLAPDGPVHLVWYAALLTCLVGGAALGVRADWGFGRGETETG